jgi:hypothetical protein
MDFFWSCAVKWWSGRVVHARARATVTRREKRREVRETDAKNGFIEMPPAATARRIDPPQG